MQINVPNILKDLDIHPLFVMAPLTPGLNLKYQEFTVCNVLQIQDSLFTLVSQSVMYTKVLIVCCIWTHHVELLVITLRLQILSITQLTQTETGHIC